MKTKFVVSAVLIMVMSIGVSNTVNARPWCHPHHHGWYSPVRVSVGIPIPPVAVVRVGGGYYDGGYRGGYYRKPYYERRGGYCGPHYRRGGGYGPRRW